MIISQLNVVLKATTSAFTREMEKAQKRMKGFRAGTLKLGTALKNMGRKAGVAAGVIAGIAWGAKKVFDLGASIEETGSKFRTVFGAAATREVSEFLDNFAAKAGLSINEAKGLVSTTGAIAQGLGFSQKASGEFAIEITKLAGDLSSFNNVPTEQVLMGINSALTGEREQMKQLGIVILEADVISKAFAQTGKDVASSLTQQEKAAATLTLITERAGSAIGDLDRTQGSAANVAKRLTARFKEIRDAVATALMPAFKNILEQLERNEQKFIEFKEKIIENTGIISAWAMVFVEAVKFVGKFIGGIITNFQNMGEMFVNVTDMAKNAGRLDWAGVKAEWEEIKANREAIKETDRQLELQAGALGAAFRLAFSGGLDAAKAFGAGVPPALDPVGPAIADIITPVDDLALKMEEIGKSIADKFVGRMTDMAQGSKDAFKGFFAWIKNELVQLAMKFLIFKAVTGILGDKVGAGSDLAEWLKDLTGFTAPVGEAMDFGRVFEGLPGGIGDGTSAALVASRGTSLSPQINQLVASRGTSLSPQINQLVASRGTSPSPQVNQVINFNVSAIDGRDAARFIREQGGEIANVVATAAKDSVGYRAALQGA